METTMTDVVRTTDLALATTLRVNGYLPSRLELNEARNGVWVYESSDGLPELVKDYHDGLVEVEPRDYNRALGRTRGELFDFLRAQGVKPARSSG
jgi:Domain of unknown function (DUF5659)